ncbi:MAG: hypothetical protein Tsb002_30800 [Wenzhouxiangellaceae bacterium]
MQSNQLAKSDDDLGSAEDMNNELKSAGALVELARQRAETDPEQLMFSFINYHARKDAADTSSLSASELDRRARRWAAALQQRVKKGERAILLFRPGLDFIPAFLGCLYAGVIAVPASMPRFGLGAERLRKIAADCSSSLILSTAADRDKVQELLPSEHELQWLTVEAIAACQPDDYQTADVGADDLALIQYSSGSTGDPKGVMISHGNLMHQAAMLSEQLGFDENSCLVSWLPTFHDMGLVIPIVVPIFRGFHAVLMAPEAFILKPLRWLQTIAEYKADYSVAPDFAYELCVRNVTDEERAALDLSHWRNAGNSAEPIRSRTIDRFCEKFASRGFNRDGLYPAYGLAEATLLVTGRNQSVKVHAFDAKSLERNRAVVVDSSQTGARELVSCGATFNGSEIQIVDPESRQALKEQQVGEVWINSASVGKGYWGKPELSEQTFQARLADGPDKPYLRTGDLGFIYQGELYICGRIKDLILIRGANHHPADIELTVEASHPALATTAGAAFSVDVDEQEKLVVVYELDRQAGKLSATELDEVASAIRKNIAEQHEIMVHAIVLLQRGLPKTTSGKVRRQECKQRYLKQDLNAVYTWNAAGSTQPVKKSRQPKVRDQSKELELAIAESAAWLAAHIARHLHREPAQIAHDLPFAEFGLKPAHLDQIIRQMELDFGFGLPVTVFTDFADIRALALHIAGYRVHGSNEEPAAGGRLLASELEVTIQRQEREKASDDEPIAIVGMACRFPQAGGPQQFWDNLCEGVEALIEVPEDRWDIDSVYDPNPLAVAKMNTRRGGFLDNIDQFDRNFFQLSLRESVRMDPAHRLLLECGWEVFEDAGIVPDNRVETSAGVFIGISGSDYAQLQFADETMADAYAGIGSALTNAASRISHFLNLRGPAIAVDTACSSSLSSVHIACNSLRRNECQMALAGGVNILLSPVVTMSLTKAGMMAPDGRCKTFDESANGYVRSEGVGLVMLKRLSQAQRDGDQIYAVIRGSASNQDGKSSGISAPNGEAQQKVVLAACTDAGILPGQLDYVEAHGTGTALGDPIEVNALGEVLKIGAEPDTYCAIGSVKTNIGHAESAAGIASLIKATLVLKHQLIPPSLNFNNPNPLIPFDQYRARVQTELGPMPQRDRPTLVGVNSFGVGGTNVHIVLEQYIADAEASASESTDDAATGSQQRELYLLPLSANSKVSLKASAQALADYLNQLDDNAPLVDVYHTLAQRRAHLDHRLAVVGADAAELAEALTAYAGSGHHMETRYGYAPRETKQSPKLAYVFSGQGSQWWAMGRRLYETEAVYRDTIDRFAAALQPHTGWSLIDVLMADEEQSLLNQTAYAQPALVALQCALAALYESWGIRPDAVTGHSVGEISAAYVSGALNFDDTCQLVAIRAQLMQEATGAGRMASVELESDALAPYVEVYAGKLAIAAINGPRTVVVSGDSEAMDALLDDLQQAGVVAISLPVNYAFHSPQMEPFKQRLIEALQAITPQPPVVPMVSTVSGEWVGDQLLDAAYWGDNLREKVMFQPAIDTLAEAGMDIFVEVGPHPVVAGSISRSLNAVSSEAAVISTLERERDDQRTFLSTVGALYTLGRPCDWAALQAGGQLLRELPRYCWDRQRYWLEAPHVEARMRLCRHPLLSARMPVAQPTWHSRLDPSVSFYLKGLRVNNRSRLPSGLFVELALAASGEHSGHQQFHEIRDIRFDQAYYLPPDGELPRLQTLISSDAAQQYQATVYAQIDESEGKARNWERVATAKVLNSGPGGLARAKPLALEPLQATAVDAFEGVEIYAKLGEIGASYEPTLHVLENIWLGENYALFKLRLEGLLADSTGEYCLHPLVFEALEQSCRIALGSESVQYELQQLQNLRLSGNPEQAAYAYARRRDAETYEAANSQIMRADVWLTDSEGNILLAADGVCFRQRQDATEDHLRIPDDPRQWLYDINWHQEDLTGDSANQAAAGDHWLVFNDRGNRGLAVAEWLRAEHGQVVHLVSHGDSFETLGEHDYQVRLDHPEDIDSLVRQALAGGRRCRGVVHCWSLDSTPLSDADMAAISHDQLLGVVSVTNIIKSVVAAEMSGHPRLWLVTGGAQPVLADCDSLELTQSTLWGLGKGIAIEHAEFRCCRVDLSRDANPAEVAGLCAEIWADQSADQVAFRDDQRYVCRLSYHDRPPAGITDGEEAAAVADMEMASASYSLAWDDDEEVIAARPLRRINPGLGEVEVRVTSCHLLPAAADNESQSPQQDYCLGQVIRSGMGVDQLSSGDPVLCLSSGVMNSHLTLPAARVIKLQSEAEATVLASLTPFLIAQFALQDLVSLNRDHRILIHGADTDVGFAAAQIARQMGANVYVTAAAEERREQLQQLRIKRVFDLDNPNVFRDIRKLTDGRGVDILVNCINQFDLDTCTPALGAFGRCLDASSDAMQGKANTTRFRLPANASFQTVDIDYLMRADLERARSLLETILKRLLDGVYAPLERPLITLDELLQTGGRPQPAIVTLPVPDDLAVDQVAPLFKEDATYLITGGLGGLGLSIAERMVQRGARHIVLIGRSAPSLVAMDAMAQLADLGARCEAMSVDVADEQAVRGMVDAIADSWPPLKGIIHAAGILDNGLLVHFDEQRLRGVMPAKVDGAWHLHTQTADLELDFFLMFSSLASLIGSHGQSNYSAANAFLDALAEHRRCQGKPGLSIAWGPWSEIGMAADVHNLRRLEEHGMGMITPDKGLGLLEDLLLEQQQGAIGAIPMNWPLWSRFFPYVGTLPYVANMIPDQQAAANYARITAITLAGMSAEAQIQELQEAIHRAVCQSMRIDPEHVEVNVPLTAIGLDSIVALEVKSRIEAGIDVVVQTNALLKGSSIHDLAQQCHKQIFAPEEGEAVVDDAAAAAAVTEDQEIDGAAELLDRLDELSQEEVEALLADFAEEEAGLDAATTASTQSSKE